MTDAASPADDWHAVETLVMTYAERVDLGDFAGVADLFAHATYRAAAGDQVTSQEGSAAVLATFEGMVRRYDDGTPGYWVAGQFRVDPTTAGVDGPTSLAVAVGFTPDRETADAAASALSDAPPQDVTLTGRLISDEGAKEPPRDADPLEITAMSPAALLSQWSDIEGLDVYRPYLASEVASASLSDIHSPPPDEGSGVNWLNIFYAVEWAVFAGFAFYLWYRLARDAWEKEVEDIQDAAEAAS